VLESIRRGQRWLTGLFIAVIGVVFAFFIGLGGPMAPTAPDTVVQLDDQSLDSGDFMRLRVQQEQRFREALGDQFDEKTARQFLDTQTLRLLVDSAVLAESAEELGLHVSREEIQRTVRQIPGFRDETGRFDQEGFIAAIEHEYGSQRQFLETLRQDLLRQKVSRLLAGQAGVSEAEARQAARQRLERVRIAAVTLEPGALPEELAPDEEAVEARAEEILASREPELKELYASREQEWATPERVRARHLLLRVPEGAPEEDVEAARERAEQARARVLQGASFADVAMEVSEDPGSSEQGGDLGPVARGDVNEALEEAIFGQEPGEVGPVIRSQRGFHVVEVEERLEAGRRSFEDVRTELARELAATELRREAADALASDLAAELEEGRPLEEAARERGLTLTRTDWISRRPDGYVPQVGSSPDLLATVFALEEGESSPRVFEVGPRKVLVQVLERQEPAPEELAEAAEERREQLESRERNALVQEWVDDRRDALVEQGRLQIYADRVLQQ